MRAILGLFCALLLAAPPGCRSTTDAAAEGVAPASGELKLAPVVVHTDDVRRLWAPNGKADVKVLARGREAFMALLRLDAGGAVPRHQDESEEYLHVLEGRGTLNIDGRDFAIRPGTTVFMPAGVTVRYTNGSEELVALQVFADPTSAAKYDKWLRDKP